MGGYLVMLVFAKIVLIVFVLFLLGVAGCGSNDNRQEKAASSVGLVAPQFDLITDDQYGQLQEFLLGTRGVPSQKWGNKNALNLTNCKNDPSLNQLHTGVDYGAAVGTLVLSPITGVVKKINRGNPNILSGLSTLVIFNEQTRTSYIFLHTNIDSNLIEGGSVSIRQSLGTVGTRGIVSGPHLHFETRSGIKLAGALCIDETTNPFTAVVNAR
jgi:murein DD-endopeptidase MepM/ murein hydrolase activator NlpD